MAIVQISKIQIRRGLDQNLPQLDSGEMGWSSDTQRLYIGNGLTTAPDYAPTTGVTEILTVHSNILNLIGLYTYQGLDSGYAVQTGPLSSTPITRKLQEKLDDIVNVRDFGAVGDGLTDNSGAITRAIQQIYDSVYLDNYPIVRRAINFPAGNYLISQTILIPPYVKFVGDGRDNTIITMANGTLPAFKTIDSQYNGTGSTLPRSISMQDLQLTTTANATQLTTSLFIIDGVTNGKFVNMKFTANVNSGTNLVFITDSITSTKNITFDNCSFNNGTYGVNVFSYGSGISSVRINNSNFDNLSGAGYVIGANINGVGSSHNYFGSVAAPRIINNNPKHYVFGDSLTGTGSANVAGVMIGRLTTSGTVTTTLPIGTTVVGQLSAGTGKLDYQIDNGSAYRFGSVQFTVTGSATTFQDDYTETATSLGGNLFINNAGYLSCGVTTAASLKYNLTQFI